MLKYNYIINLETRQDRWIEITEKISKSCLRDENFIKYNAFNGYEFENEITRFNLEEDFIYKYLKDKKMKVSKGVFGCYMSHYLLLKSIHQNKEINDDEWVGIFEDDFFPHDNQKIFTKNWKSLKGSKEDLDNLNLDMVYLGGRFQSNFMVPIHDFYLNFDITNNANIFTRKNIYELVRGNIDTKYLDRTTTSYIVKKTSISKILKALSLNFIQKSNNIFYFRPIDHAYIYSSNLIKSADFFPHLFYSPEDYKSDIQGVENIQKIIQF